MTKTLAMLAGMLLGAACAVAQTDSVQRARAIPQITVREFRFDGTGFSKWRADTVRHVASAAQLLFSENIVSLRSNAPGALTSASARGVGGSRTAIVWNGLPLQNPMNGFADLSLLPIWPSDRVAVQLGGQSAAHGSGAMGGAVLLRSEPMVYAQKIGGALGLSVGSFGERQADAEAGWGLKKWTGALRAQAFAAENDFSFRNTSLLGKPCVRQAHNRVARADVQQFNRVFLGKNALLETAAWWQNAAREIPPSMTEAPSTARQWDKSLRAVANFRAGIGRKSSLAACVGWLDEAIFFHLAGDVDSSRSRSGLVGADFSSEIFRKTAVRTGFSASFTAARSDGYADTSAIFRQTRPQIYVAASQPFRFGRATALVRQEFSDGRRLPLTWSLAADLLPENWLGGRLHLSRNFNVPTFNDRFWQKWGNSDLRPESGMSGDMSLIVRQKAWSAEATAFSILVDDWIQWLPGADGFFRPGNLRRVWSRGAEATVLAQHDLKKTRLSLAARYAFTRATNVRTYAPNDPALGRQLVYVPRHAGSFSAKMEHGKWSASYQQSLVGRRFSQPDNAARVAGFSTGNLSAWWRIPLKNNALSLFASVENLWGASYQIIAFRPMPGRAWRVGVRWQG